MDVADFPIQPLLAQLLESLERVPRLLVLGVVWLTGANLIRMGLGY